MGVAHGEIRFRAPCFLPGATSLSTTGATVRLRPMHPTLFRPGNFKEKDFAAPLVYLGQCTEQDLARVAGIPLDGALALVEFDSVADWLRLLRFGVKGFVFIEPERCAYSDAASKVYATEVAVPRFMVDRADGVALRRAVGEAGGALPTTVRADPSRWESRFLRDLWAMVPGSDPQLAKEVVVLIALLDSNSVVPELAVGAQAAANLRLLLRLTDAFRECPPARSVLFVAVNAHTQKFLGERMLAWNLLMPSQDVESLRNALAADIRVQELTVETYGRLTFDPARRQDDETFLINLRTLADESTGRHLTLKEPIVSVVRRDANLLRSRIADLTRRDLSTEEMTRQRAELEAKRRECVRILTLFNRVGIQTRLSDLAPAEVERLKDYVAEVLSQSRRGAELNREDIGISVANAKIARMMAGRRVAAVLSLEMTWQNDVVGWTSGNYWGTMKWPVPFGANAVRIAADLKAVRAGERRNLLADTMTNVGGMPEGYFFPYVSSGIGFFHSAQTTPAFALANVFTDGGRAFGPRDTLENLNPRNVAEISAFAEAYLCHLLDDPKVTDSSGLPAFIAYPAWSVRIHASRFDEYAATVLPSLPVANAVVVLHDIGTSLSGDAINAYMALTDERATAEICGINKNTTYVPVHTIAYHLDADFRNVDYVIDAGDAHAQVNSNLTKTDRLILALFSCEEIPIYDRNDPSLVFAAPITVSQYLLLDSRWNATPRRYGAMGLQPMVSSKRLPSMSGPAAFYVEPGARVKVLTRQKRLALGATRDVPEGMGYRAAGAMGPDFFRTAASDMAHLNRQRLANLRGVSDDLATGFHERGLRQLEQADAHRQKHDYLGYLRALAGALGGQVKAYRQLSATTNDMLKAVVCYMALMLPFCFFVQRLVFSTVRIEAQMALFLGLFILTYTVFRTIHPAFVIARSAEAMFIAFVMGALGLFVINVLHGRFEGEMQLLFRTYAGSDQAGIAYAKAGQQAMIIGVNNMKRRRIRTALTTGTIVLVTFTMLAFTSVSSTLSPTIVSKGRFASYTGFMYHWPGRTMDEATAQVFKDLFHGRGQITVRRWLLAPRLEWLYQQLMLPFRVQAVPSGRTADVEAVLGLPVADDGFLDRMPLMEGGRFFSSDDANEAVLPASLAESLGITPENFQDASVMINGKTIRVVGILDDERLRSIRDIDNCSLLPVKSMLRKPATELEPGSDRDALVDAGAEEAGIFYFDSSTVLVLPEGTCRRLGGLPYSVSVKLNDDQPLWDVVTEILTATYAKFYVSSRTPFRTGKEGTRTTEAGVYYVGTGFRTSIGGLSRLIIPLLIASTIILNTMLGSVFERKQEIAIYNAVGLNPTHIGTFFLAEALVYSVIGSVGGYLIGQVLSLTLNRYGLVRDINLNFSSLSVVYVIFFTIGVVLLSTLYPAVVATRAAVPSGKRKWSMPPHEGSRMEVTFPYIYQSSLVPGVMRYLEEYFGRFTDAAMGDMIAALRHRSRAPDAAGRDVFTLDYRVALPPYDLGVTQDVRLRAAYDPTVQSHRLWMTIERVSGQDSNWVTTNKPFLERLRKYLMHWRNLAAAAHGAFVERGTTAFAETP